VLTGDPSPAARKTCLELGIDDVYTGLSPQQKLEYAKQWQSEGDVLMMVGDGINDVPTLAGAEVAITIGSASDLAQTNADSIVTSGHLASLGAAMMKAKDTRRIIKQNIGWALLYNLIALPMAATGMIPPWAAALGMSFSSLIVVFNALRLLKKEADWHKAQLA
jgi:Cu2+-exporting ATPase